MILYKFRHGTVNTLLYISALAGNSKYSTLHNCARWGNAVFSPVFNARLSVLSIVLSALHNIWDSKMVRASLNVSARVAKSST